MSINFFIIWSISVSHRTPKNMHWKISSKSVSHQQLRGSHLKDRWCCSLTVHLMNVDALCYEEWYVNWHSLFLCPISHSVCVQLFLIVLFVPLLQTLAGIHWNCKQCFDSADCCEINIARKCCEAHLYVGEVTCRPKEAKKKNRALRNKHSPLWWKAQADFSAVVYLNIQPNAMCTMPRNTPPFTLTIHIDFLALQCTRHLTIKWNYNP